MTGMIQRKLHWLVQRALAGAKVFQMVKNRCADSATTEPVQAAKQFTLQFDSQ